MPQNAFYNVAGPRLARGSLNSDSLEQAFRELVRRHEPLRTRFVEEDGEPWQIVEADNNFQLEIVDLSGAGNWESKLHSRLREVAATPFDLRRARSSGPTCSRWAMMITFWLSSCITLCPTAGRLE